MSMLYFHCHIVIYSSLKYAVFIISYVALYHFQSKITIGTFHIFVRRNCTHLTIFVRFYLLYFDQSVQKKAKPALCFARIAKAILGGIMLHNSIFLFHKKTPLQEQNSCRGVVFLTKLAAYRKGLFILWSVPFPIANFFKILTILSDILLMLNKLVVHLLDEVGTTVC